MNDSKKMQEWIASDLPQVTKQLENNLVSPQSDSIEISKEILIEGRKKLYEILENIREVIFYETEKQENIFAELCDNKLANTLKKISGNLYEQILGFLKFHRSKSCETSCSCEEKAFSATTALIESLPEIRQDLIFDIKSGFDGDPASKSYQEIILSYPYIEAVMIYRVAHRLYELKVPLIPRIMTEWAHSKTGIDIHPGAVIGKGFFIDHGTGVVIGETCVIGKNVTIYHGVTLGAFSPYDRENNRFQGKKRHPNVEDDVIIYAGAVILGGDTVIGKGSVIGGNALITKSVKPNSKVYKKNEMTVFKVV